MRRQNRRSFNEEKETNKIVYISLGVLIIAILAFAITFIIYSNYLNNDTKIAEFKTTTIKELEEMNKENSSQASSSIGKTVDEMENEQQNTNKKEEVTKIAINTTNMEKETIDSENNQPKETSTNIEKSTNDDKVEQLKKVENPTFIKPVEGEILVNYANDKLIYSNTLKEWVTHNGIDIKSDKTTVVKASSEGTVKSIKNDPRYGITVVIEHANGFSSVYSNLLTAEFVVEGEKVKSGQTIGTVGNTATFEIADESHLHFEILKDGKSLDPTLYVKY